MSGPSALVVGGGLAGLTAALDLADAGLNVTVVEKRPFLGGRVYSHKDKATGLEVDNGQHVFLGCCTEYIRLVKRLGLQDRVHLQKRLRVPIIDKVWGESMLASSRLPAPFHLFGSLMRFRSLSPPEKLAAMYALAQLRSIDHVKQPELDDITFEDWLRARHQGPHAIRSLWNLVIQPTLNDDISRVSAGLALMVFQEGFLRSRDGANVGWSKVGLTSLLPERALEHLERRGARVLPDATAKRVDLEGGRFRRLMTDGAELEADVCVLAVSPAAMLELLPEGVAEDAFFARTGKIDSSPIVNVHLWYDRTVWDRPFAAFLNTPLQWLFNKSRLWGLPDDGQYLDISLSAARDFVDLPSQEIVPLFAKEVAALVPAARGAQMTRALVIKEREATFAPLPGTARLRPSQETPVPGLFLSGDWTDTGWPGTMESAVRSGALASRAALREMPSELRTGAIAA